MTNVAPIGPFIDSDKRQNGTKQNDGDTDADVVKEVRKEATTSTQWSDARSNYRRVETNSHTYWRQYNVGNAFFPADSTKFKFMSN